MYIPFCHLLPEASEQPWLKRARLKKGNAWGLEAGDYLVYDLYPASPEVEPVMYFNVEQAKTGRLMLTAHCEPGQQPWPLKISTRHLQSPQAPEVLEWLRELLLKPEVESALLDRMAAFSASSMRSMFASLADEPEAQQQLLQMLRQTAPPDLPAEALEEMLQLFSAGPDQLLDRPTGKPARKSGRRLKAVASGSLRLKVTLKGAPLPIWRKLELPASLSLSQLHTAIQAAMGWHDCHLWEFSDGRESYMPSDPYGFGGGDEIDPDTVQVGELLGQKGDKLLYTYDMGDSWEHVVEVVEALPTQLDAAVIGGKNACPPEDCGGVWGYADILQMLKKTRKSKSDKEILEWLGGDFEPEAFALDVANRRLASRLH